MFSLLWLLDIGAGLLIILLTVVALRLTGELIVRALGAAGMRRARQSRETFIIEEWRHNRGGSNPIVVLGAQHLSRQARPKQPRR